MARLAHLRATWVAHGEEISDRQATGAMNGRCRTRPSSSAVAGSLPRSPTPCVRLATSSAGPSVSWRVDRTTSHTTIWRIERGAAGHLDLAAVERVLTALGIRATLQLDARHLGDRRRQHDAVHARLTGYVARRLERSGWVTRTEVPIGGGQPRGWIDLLAFREADRRAPGRRDQDRARRPGRDPAERRVLRARGADRRATGGLAPEERRRRPPRPGQHGRGTTARREPGPRSARVLRRRAAAASLGRRTGRSPSAWLDRRHGGSGAAPRGLAQADTAHAPGRRSYAYVDYADAAAKLRRRR